MSTLYYTCTGSPRRFRWHRKIHSTLYVSHAHSHSHNVPACVHTSAQHHWQNMLVDMFIRVDTYYYSCTGSYYSCTGSHVNTCQCEHEQIRNTMRVHLPCIPTLSHCNYTHACIHTHAQHPPFPHRQQCTSMFRPNTKYTSHDRAAYVRARYI